MPQVLIVAGVLGATQSLAAAALTASVVALIELITDVIHQA